MERFQWQWVWQYWSTIKCRHHWTSNQLEPNRKMWSSPKMHWHYFLFCLCQQLRDCYLFSLVGNRIKDFFRYCAFGEFGLEKFWDIKKGGKDDYWNDVDQDSSPRMRRWIDIVMVLNGTPYCAIAFQSQHYSCVRRAANHHIVELVHKVTKEVFLDLRERRHD